MMIFKRIFKFLLPLALILVLFCQKDDSISNENIELPKLKIETLYKPDFSFSPILSQTLTNLKSNTKSTATNAFAREVYIEDYGFTIDDQVVKHISYGEYDSYTFLIVRDVDNGLVENLLLSKQKDGSYKPLL